MNMIWNLYHEGELIEQFSTNHSISLQDAIELCGFIPNEKHNIDEADYIYNGVEIWLDCLELRLAE